MKRSANRVLLLVTLLAAACGDGLMEMTSVDRQANLTGETITVTAGNNQIAATGTRLPKTIKFIVRDAGSAPIGDARGTIVVTSGGGTTTKSSFRTQANGTASFIWTLGPTGGNQTVTITLNSNPAANAVVTARAVPSDADLVIVYGSGQTDTPGDTLSLPVRVRLTDSGGNPLVGVPISWEVRSGGGGLRKASLNTNINGEATNRWALGWESLNQTLVAKFPGVDSVTFTATANPAGYTLEIVSGNNQSGPPNTALPANIIVVLKKNGVAVENGKGTFAVTAGGGSTSRTNFTTNAIGRGFATWTLGASGTQTVVAEVPIVGSVTFNATLTVASSFNISVVYAVAPTAAQQAAVEAAITRWRQVITGDLTDINMTGAPAACGLDHTAGPIVDDLLINVDFGAIDGAGGILGSAGPCYYRNSNKLPITGQLKLDAADLANMEANGSLEDVILHEIGHILGIGTLWGLATAGPTAGPLREFASTDSVSFKGATTQAAFLAAGGNTFVGRIVPVENCVGIPGCGAGTINGHWRELVMGHELMTGYLSGTVRALSLITVRSLHDMGYTVDVNAADAYTVSPSLRAGPEPDAVRLNEVAPAWSPKPIDDVARRVSRRQ